MDLSSFLKYVDSFVEASRCDPYLTELLGRTECEGHGDGWGYTIVGVRDGGGSLSIHYRTTLPVYRDSGGTNNLKNFIRQARIGVLIAHSRRLAEGSARIGNTHPIHYSWKGFEMWIAHNGVMNSDELSRELGVTRLPDTTDTYYLGEYLYRHLSGVNSGELAEALRSVTKYTKTAMNTLIILYDDKRLTLSVTSYLTKERVQNPLVVRYYRVLVKKSKDSYAFFSSSISSYLRTADSEELPLQTAVIIELDLNTGQLLQSTYTLG